MTDVMSAPTRVIPNAANGPSSYAITTTDCGGRLVLPDLTAGTPAITMFPWSKCFFIRRPIHGTERSEDDTRSEDIHCVSQLRLQLDGRLFISGSVFRLTEVHEARGSLDVEKRFPCADSLTGVYSIYRGTSFTRSQRYRSSLCTIPVKGSSNLSRLEGWVVVTLPRLYANLSFGAAMEHWCAEPMILRASRLCIKPSHRHDCAVKKRAATPSALPRLLVRQSDGMLMLLFYTVATDPSTVSGSFCACKSAFQIVFSSYHSPEEVNTVAMATPFANNSLGLQELELEPPEAVRTSLTERLSRQTEFSKGNSIESSENNKVKDKANLVSKAQPVARQQRSLSESSAYQIPQVSRRGILKNGTDWRRTISESSDEFLSSLSLDSDTSLPASSLESVQPKKTVSFNNHVTNIVYRANSSVLARRRRNQKKAANKKKAAARRALNRCDSTDTSGVSSGSEASLEDVSQSCQVHPSE
ncbi:hypothetical protein MRX96_005158 [Rhipicephalus microplus]